MRQPTKPRNCSGRLAVGMALVLVSACAPPSADELIEKSAAALHAGKPRTAQIHLQNLLQQEPNNVVARAMLGQVALETGDPATAEHNLRAALELGTDPAPLQIPLLQALLLQGKYVELLAQASSGPQLEGPDAITVMTLEGAAHRGRGDLEQAEAAYRRALAMGASGEARAELAAVVFAAGRTAEALELVDEALTATPELVAALLVRGAIESTTSRYGAAETTFKRVLEIENERRNGRDYAIALSGLIETQLASRKLGEAAVNADALLALQPQGVQAQFLKAWVEVEQGALEGAGARLENVILNAPQHWPSHTLLGVIKSRQNQLGQAEMYLRQATSGNPADSRPKLLLAEVYLKQGNVGALRDLMDRSSTAGDSQFLALAGRLTQGAGQESLAAEFFARSEQNPPKTVRELGEIVSVYLDAGEIDRAIRVLESASFEGAENDKAALYLLTLLQLRQGNAAAAAEVANRLGDQDPESLNLRGTVALLANDVAGARTFFARATELAPRYIPAWLNLARAASAENDLDRAAEYLRQVLEIEPSQLNALRGLTQLAVQQGNFAEAEDWVARMPDSPLRYRASGDLYSAQRRFAEAYDAYSQALARAPASDLAVKTFTAARAAGRPEPEAVLLRWLKDNPNDAEVNFALGSLSIEAGDLAAAEKRFEAALAKNANHVATLNNLAWLYDQRGDPRALEFAQRAYNAAPGNPAVADTLGWLYVSRGDVAHGLPLLEQATNAAPALAEIRYHFAVALEEADQRVRAAEVLAELLASSAQFPGRAEAEERLARLQSPR